MRDLTINGRPWKVFVSGTALSLASWAIAEGIESDRSTQRAHEFKRTVDYCWAIVAANDWRYADTRAACLPFLKGQMSQKLLIDYAGVETDYRLPFDINSPPPAQ